MPLYLPYLLCCSPWGRCSPWVLLPRHRPWWLSEHCCAISCLWQSARGCAASPAKRGHSTGRGHTCCMGSNWAAGEHQTQEWLFQSHCLKRCFCTWNTLGVDSQTSLCFCFTCTGLWPVRCSMAVTLEKDWRCSLHWLWEGVSGNAIVLACGSTLSEEPSLSFLNHCFPLILMPFWASTSQQHYSRCMLPLPLHQAHINTNHWGHCSLAPSWQAAGRVWTTLCVNYVKNK